ncbi:MAG: 2-phospho-L-lactate transferase CofD family protein, partial [Planctomycetota bacterium]|nr:2-phospho-L-lactate transferase CofD family protein [Planctomycetota bacterium]
AVICFPMGSFWTSLVANLLPSGVGRAIAGSGASKVYIPNLGEDPEQHGMTISDCIRVLHHQVAQDLGADIAVDEVVGSILIDHRNGAYGDRLDLDEIASLGVQVLDLDLFTENSHSLLDATLLSKALLALAR